MKLFLRIDGHNATTGEVYPGMGNPTEYYPSCSCGWRGMPVFALWEKLDEEQFTFSLSGYPKSVGREGNFIVPDFISGTGDYGLIAYKQVLDHLQVPLKFFIDEARDERNEFFSSLKTAASLRNIDEMKRLIDLVDLANLRLESLRRAQAAEGLSFDLQSWRTKEVQEELQQQYTFFQERLQRDKNEE